MANSSTQPNHTPGRVVLVVILALLGLWYVGAWYYKSGPLSDDLLFSLFVVIFYALLAMSLQWQAERRCRRRTAALIGQGKGIAYTRRFRLWPRSAFGYVATVAGIMAALHLGFLLAWIVLMIIVLAWEAIAFVEPNSYSLSFGQGAEEITCSNPPP